MATSKTLTPTNQTISIPALGDAPDASVFSNCIEKEADAINTLNSQLEFINRSIQVPYTCESYAQFNTNLKTLVDADLPSGYTVLGIVGYTTNDVNVHMIACRYYNTAYSLQIKNIGSTAISNNVVVTYLAKHN